MTIEDIVVDGYLVVEPVENLYGVVNSAKFVKVTKRKPQLENNQRAVWLSVKIPLRVFDPLGPVRIEIPEGEIITPEVTVG